MLSRVILTVALSIFTAGAYAQNTVIRYLNDWKWEGQAAPLLLAQDRGFFTAEALDVTLEPGTGSVNTIPRVASGEFHMGSADINSLITWRDKHPDVDMKAIFIIYNEAPYAVLGRPSQGVTGPLDLEGRVVGAPRLDGAYAQWPAFIHANGILEDRVTVQDVGFPDRERMLADGEVDAITGFSFSSYISLQSSGVPAEDISLMLMSDFGLNLYGNAIIVNPEFAEQNPQAVAGFLRAVVKGFQETVANPSSAIEHVMARNEAANADIELQRLVMAVGHHIDTREVRTMGLGGVIDSRLEKSIRQLDAIHDYASQLTAGDIFDDRFLPEYDARLLP